MTVLASIPAWIVEIGIQVSLHLMTLLEEIQIPGPVQADKAPLVGPASSPCHALASRVDHLEITVMQNHLQYAGACRRAFICGP